MSGINQGAAAQILNLQQQVIYLYYYAHSLNLAV